MYYGLLLEITYVVLGIPVCAALIYAAARLATVAYFRSLREHDKQRQSTKREVI